MYTQDQKVVLKQKAFVIERQNRRGCHRKKKKSSYY